MSHFTVMVIGDNIDEQLAPYNEGIEVERYRRYWDSDTLAFHEKILRESYGLKENATLEELAEAWNARYPGEDDEEDEDKAHIDDGGIFEWSTYNPKSKWDWYEIGGRWRGYFKTKNGSGQIGEPGVFDNEARYDADIVRKGDIDIEGMRDEAGRRAGDLWDKVHEVIGELPEATPWSEFVGRITIEEITIEEARAQYGEQPRVVALRDHEDLVGIFGGPEDFQMPREEYVQRARDSALAPYAYVMDGEWYGQGKMGWWGMSDDHFTQEQWSREFNELLDSLPDDTLLTLVDAHI